MPLSAALQLLLLSAPLCRAFLAQGFSTFFSTPCPAGWAEIPAARGRLIVSVTDASLAGLTVGAALGAEEDRTHTHNFSGTFTLPSKHLAAVEGGNDRVGAESGAKFPFGGVTNAAESGLPFVQFFLCRLLADSGALGLPFGGVGYYSPEVQACPANASAYAIAQGRALVPGYIATGGAPFPVSSMRTRSSCRRCPQRLAPIPLTRQTPPLPPLLCSPLTRPWPRRRTARTRTPLPPPSLCPL